MNRVPVDVEARGAGECGWTAVALEGPLAGVRAHVLQEHTLLLHARLAHRAHVVVVFPVMPHPNMNSQVVRAMGGEATLEKKMQLRRNT